MSQSVHKTRRWPWILGIAVALLGGCVGGAGFMTVAAYSAFRAPCPRIYEPMPGEMVFRPDSGGVMPRPLNRRMDLAVPPAGRLARVNGTVQTLFYVERDGRVSRIELGRSSGFCPYDVQALRDARALQFAPGGWQGEPAAGWVSLSITYFGGIRPAGVRPRPPARSSET
jgi:TonB family protein